MLRWSVLFTAAIVAILTVAGWILGGKTPSFRVVFFVGLALWQSAMTVCLYCRDRKPVRADCLGVGLVSVLVTVIYMLVRFPSSWRAILAGLPLVLAAALAGAALAWRASERRMADR